MDDEKQAKKERLLDKSSQLNQDISNCEQIDSDLRRSLEAFTALDQEWMNGRNYYYNDPNIAQIQVEDVFQGSIAEELSLEIPERIRLMDHNIERTDNIISGINRQISNLQEYMQKLETQVAGIRTQINNLD